MRDREKRLAYMREYNKTHKRKRPHTRSNPEAYREYNREYLAKYYREKRVENLDAYRKKHRESQKRWRDNNAEAARAIYARWRAKNPDATRKACLRIEVRIARNVRNRVWYAVKRGQRAGSAVRDLGCSIAEFKAYIATKFSPGMSWENYGAWHLDHIEPISAFDLTVRDQFLKACRYTNYQPLWARDNLVKATTRLAA